MGRYQKLGKNIALLTLGNFASKLLSFLLLPLYTSILTTAEYGTADMVTTTVNLIMPMLTLLIYESVMRYALDKECDNTQVFSIGLYVIITGCAVMIIAGLFFSLIDSLREYVWLFVLYYLSLAFYNLILQFTKGIEKIAVYSTAGVINTFVYIGCNIIFLLFLRWGVAGYLMSFVIAHVVAAIYTFITARLQEYIISISRISKSFAKKMINYAYPMIPNSISWWISNSSDKYILTYFWGVSVNGVYSIAYKIPSILTIVISIFISAWQISAVEDFGSDASKKFYADIYDKYESILYMGASLLIGFSPIIGKLMFTSEFYIAWLYTPVLVLASVWNSIAAFYGSVYTSAKRTNMLMYSTLAGAIGNVLLNLTLIPQYGAMGAAIATLISYGIVWVIRAVNSKKIFDFAVKTKRDFLLNAVLLIEIILVCSRNNPYFIFSSICAMIVVYWCKGAVVSAANTIFVQVLKKKNGREE